MSKKIASGSAFFDDAVSADKITTIAVGVGIPGYKSRSGKVLPSLELKC